MAKMQMGLAAIKLRNGITLEYVEHGGPSGLRIVFLHGGTDSWRSFEPVLPHLPSAVHAFVPTQRGHGDSDRPESGYRFLDFSNDLHAFMDALDIPAALIVGHSMGSYVGLRFAIDHPDRTLGLVLVGAFPTLRRNAGVQELWDGAVSTLTDPVGRDLVVDFQTSTLARPISPDFLDTVVAESLKVPARVWREMFTDFRTADFSNEIGGLTAPTLIMWGDRDSFMTREDQLALNAAIRDSRLLIYPGGGHAIHWEDPERFTADLLAFAAEALAHSEQRLRGGNRAVAP